MSEARYHLSTVVLSLLLVSAACLAVFSFPRAAGVFPLDDAYIHWVYADNLAAGRGFSFNAGEPSMGTSSPIFVFLGAFALWLGLDYYAFTVFSSVALFAGSAVLVFLIARRLLRDAYPNFSGVRRDAYAFLGGLLFAANGNFSWYVLSGMETSLCVFMGLLGLYLYMRRGWDWLTGLILGLLLWVRITGLSLLVVLFLTDLLRRRFSWRGYAVTGLVYAPFLAFSLQTCGALLPTNVAAKKMTYVDGEWSLVRFFDFFRAIFVYLAFVPPFRAAVVLTAGWAIAAPLISVARKKRGQGAVRMPASVWILMAWGLVHVTMYGLTFRALLHHLRYLAEIYPVLAAATAFVLFALCGTRGRGLAAFGALALAGLVLLSGWNEIFWANLYRENIRHIQNVYMPAAEWLKRNTPPDARVAAFDIGVAKHISGRYVIDVGGLVDPNIHPYLKTHRAGDFIREQGATYILYSCEPDCDLFTGLYFAEYEGEKRLQQSRAASFATGHYSMPTITHSTRLEIYRVDNWRSEDLGEQVKLFVVDAAVIQHTNNLVFNGNVMLLGYDLEPDPVVRCKEMIQHVDLTYYWTMLARIDAPFWVETQIGNAARKPIFSKKHIPTHNRYPPPDWKRGETIRDHHVIWLDSKWKPGRYEIRLTTGGKTNVIGSVTLTASPLKPVAMKWKKLK